MFFQFKKKVRRKYFHKTDGLHSTYGTCGVESIIFWLKIICLIAYSP